MDLSAWWLKGGEGGSIVGFWALFCRAKKISTATKFGAATAWARVLQLRHSVLKERLRLGLNLNRSVSGALFVSSNCGGRVWWMQG